MDLEALIVEQLEEDGTLRSLEMKRSIGQFNLVVSFPDQYDEPRDGPFHFYDQETARHFFKNFAQCRHRRIGPRHFFRKRAAYHVDLGWEGIPTAGDNLLTYYALSLPENAIPINLIVTDPHSPVREYRRTVTRDDQRQRYVIYLDCSSPQDHFDFRLSCDFEIDPAKVSGFRIPRCESRAIQESHRRVSVCSPSPRNGEGHPVLRQHERYGQTDIWLEKIPCAMR